MLRNLESEIDSLKDQVQELSTMVKHLMGLPKSSSPLDEESSQEHKDMKSELSRKCPRAYELKRQNPDAKSTVSYFGFYETGSAAEGQSYFWDLQRSGEELLSIDDERVAQVLTALGNKQRVAILKSILKKPGSAQDLVSRLNLGTTGQVYHHIKALQSADLIKQEERGLFAFKGHRVTGLIMLLTGVAEMIDEKYSSGNWDEETEG